MSADLTPHNPEKGANQEALSPAEISPPSVGEDLRLKQRIQDALAKVSSGDTIDRYFGISGGVPEQSAAAAEGNKLVDGLREISHGGGDLSALLGRIAQHNASSGIEPDLLRALRQPRSKAE